MLISLFKLESIYVSKNLVKEMCFFDLFKLTCLNHRQLFRLKEFDMDNYNMSTFKGCKSAIYDVISKFDLDLTSMEVYDYTYVSDKKKKKKYKRSDYRGAKRNEYRNGI